MLPFGRSVTIAALLLVASSSIARADGDAAANAGADAGVSAAAEPAPSPSHDLGTRWVLLAAVGGLIVGGLLAARRKRASPEK